jgi:hypothetical protein
MGKDELIVKQQLEIEELKNKVEMQTELINTARGFLYIPEQWNFKCTEFPKVAMKSIVSALRAIDDI